MTVNEPARLVMLQVCIPISSSRACCETLARSSEACDGRSCYPSKSSYIMLIVSDSCQ